MFSIKDVHSIFPIIPDLESNTMVAGLTLLQGVIHLNGLMLLDINYILLLASPTVLYELI
jgi:hypothetical protein